ncbi:MAG: carbon storage regulator CsrA [Gammaproteobacteria bacterium]
MLVLTRKPNEGITIDDNIKIQILNIKGNQIKIGIQAPKSVLVYRDEVYQHIQNTTAQKEKSDDAK